VFAVRGGVSIRVSAERFGLRRGTLEYWLRRAEGRRLDRVEWNNRPPIPVRPRRTAADLEDLIVAVRQALSTTSALGFHGAVAIQQALQERGIVELPSVRTIGRVLERRGVLDGCRRVRRPPPPRGWYLGDLARKEVDLDSFDVVEGMVIQGEGEVEVLNGMALHATLVGSWPARRVTARSAIQAILSHWTAFGLPAYAQFDNDTRFQGAHQFPDAVGRVTRLCLGLGVIPVFVIPGEHGFQASIEAYNGLWQSKVWSRYHHASLAALRKHSAAFVAAHRRRAAARLEAGPPRRAVPGTWQLDLAHPLHGRIIYLRRTTEHGSVDLLGHRFLVDPHWSHRMVRAEVHLDAGHISFYGLRRSEPSSHLLLKVVHHVVPNRPLRE